MDKRQSHFLYYSSVKTLISEASALSHSDVCHSLPLRRWENALFSGTTLGWLIWKIDLKNSVGEPLTTWQFKMRRQGRICGGETAPEVGPAVLSYPVESVRGGVLHGWQSLEVFTAQVRRPWGSLGTCWVVYFSQLVWDPQLGEGMDWRVCRTYGTEVIYHSDKGIHEMQKNGMI